MAYFDILPYIKDNPNCHRFYVVGARGAGKSYSIKKHLLEDAAKGKKFLYLVKTTTDITSTKMNRIFSDVTVDHPEIFKDTNFGDFYRYHVMYKSGTFWLVGETEDGALDWVTDIGLVSAVTMGKRFKGGVYNDIKNIFYDEFISETVFCNDELDRFTAILLTVARSINDVKVFFAGNPDNGIERSPFLYPLKLDYRHLQENTPYFYDTKIDGKTFANNIMFIKITASGGEYINTAAIDVSNDEIEMSLSGEVKTTKYCKVSRELVSALDPEIEMIVETPIITYKEYRRKIYAYIGTYIHQPALYILSHRIRKYKQVPATIYCRYDRDDIREHDYYQTYRLNLPSQYHRYSAVLNDIFKTQMIVTDDDINATLFFDIYQNG